VNYVLIGLGLGLGAGLAPGPLLALVITTSLARGFRPGLRVALSPLVTDSIMIAVAVLVVRELPARASGVLGVVGGLYVVWLGVESLREQSLSPHPWLFWLTVGGSVVVSAWTEAPAYAALFVVTFFVAMIGTKAVIAAVVSTSRKALTQRGLHRAHRVAGALLLLTGVLLAAEFARHLLAP